MPDHDAGAVVRTRGVGKTFGAVVALEDLDLAVDEGEIVGIVGPSGSGKTTAVRLMIGAYQPTVGELELWGEQSDDLSSASRQRIGYLPQQPALLPDLSILENLHLHASLVGLGIRGRKQRFGEVLDLVALADQSKTKVRKASGGMQRRAALAASLLHHPDLIVLDEPTAGIDPVLRAQLWSHFEALRDAGTTLIVTTQYIGEARYCDRVAVIVDGRLLAFDTPRGLRHRVHGGDVVDVVLDGHVPPEVIQAIERHELALGVDVTGRSTLAVIVGDGGQAIAAIGPVLSDLGHSPLSMEERIIDFDEMFVQLVRSAGSEATIGAN